MTWDDLERPIRILAEKMRLCAAHQKKKMNEDNLHQRDQKMEI